MCSSFTWGTVSVHYLLRLPLEYAFRSATPNGLMLLLKLTYSRAMLSPIDSLYLFFFFLTDSRSSKSTQDCAWESGRLQHMIQWIPAKRGTWQRPRVHMRITEGSLLR